MTIPPQIGIAADHGGFELKQYLLGMLRAAGHSVVEFGDTRLDPDDDYPDFVVPLAHAVGSGDMIRGVAICGSGVGASIAANKVAGVRACLIHDTFSAHQGVEDDDLNLLCLGGLVVGHALAWEYVRTFLAARFIGAERHRRRLAKVANLEAAHGENAEHTEIRNNDKRKTIMAIKLKENDGGKVLEVQVSGKLAHEDYLDFVPKFEQLIKQHGKLRVFFDMTDFHGWEAGALWDDIKLDIKHFSDIERLAMIGDKAWEKQMSLFCRPFTTAKIRYFDKADAAEAWAWLEGDLVSK